MNQTNNSYQIPHEDLVNLVDTPLTPVPMIGSDPSVLLFLERPSMPGIDQLATEELKLAGLRIDPQRWASSRPYYYNGIWLRVEGKRIDIIGLPEDPKIEHVSWSPNRKRFAFTQTTDEGLQLWAGSVETSSVSCLFSGPLNDVVTGAPFRWMPNSRQLLIRTVPDDVGSRPQRPKVPTGPIIQESTGKKSPQITYQDLLKDTFDEQQFEYFSQCQLALIDLEGSLKKLGNPGMYRTASPSPDGQYFLIFQVKRPFSYTLPSGRFPLQVDIWDSEGESVKTVANLPLADDIPQGFGAVRKGPRSFYWRADEEASLYWVEALDDGDPKKEMPHRDRILHIEAPFSGPSVEAFRTELRFGGFTWGTGKLAIYDEWRWEDRKIKTWAFAPDDPQKKHDCWFDRSWEDNYNDPGNFEMERTASGRAILLQRDGFLFLKGEGHSPKGKIPFLDQFEIASGLSSRIWESKAPNFEAPIRLLLKDESRRLLFRRESQDTPPNYWVQNLDSGQEEAITSNPHPYEQLKSVEKQQIEYQRKDGVTLRGQLYLPPGYDPIHKGRIPVLMWAYPESFKSADAAGQVKDSPYQFIPMYSMSPLVFLSRGYAVFAGFSMPIIGEGDSEPNEQFISQLTMNAKSAIDKLVEVGVADRNRIAIGGHSYGAFMTANLLAHTNLFAAGIARSGAYNRTLTPFGFQSEERSFWEARDTYIQMSPFAFVDQIKTPLLLIHGDSDPNPGTYPMQSERLYQALKGHGAVSRLVKLPLEGHGYRSRESVLHMLWEMDQWLELYLKA